MGELPSVRRRWQGRLVVGAVCLVVSGWIVSFDPAKLVAPTARQQLLAFVQSGLPPDLSRSYLVGRTVRDGLLWAIVETLAISIVGTGLAVCCAVPASLLSASSVTHEGPLYVGASEWRLVSGRLVHTGVRWLLSFCRAVPAIVWGVLFVTALGLGPFAGVLALAVHNTGVLGKLFADFLEETDPLTTEAVATVGASRLQAVCHGMVPQITATVASYTVYRWECTIRSAAVLGFVGAGGIGYHLLLTVQRLQYQRLTTAIIAVFGLVLLSDWLASRVRASLG